MVLFDLGDTLGAATTAGDQPRLTSYEVFPYAAEVMADLRARGVRVGVMSNTGSGSESVVSAVFRPTGVLDGMDTNLLIYSADEAPLADGTPVAKYVPESCSKGRCSCGLAGIA